MWDEIWRAMSRLKSFWGICRGPFSLWEAGARKEEGERGFSAILQALSLASQEGPIKPLSGPAELDKALPGQGFCNIPLRAPAVSDLHRPLQVCFPFLSPAGGDHFSYRGRKSETQFGFLTRNYHAEVG